MATHTKHGPTILNTVAHMSTCNLGTLDPQGLTVATAGIGVHMVSSRGQAALHNTNNDNNNNNNNNSSSDSNTNINSKSRDNTDIIRVTTQ